MPFKALMFWKLTWIDSNFIKTLWMVQKYASSFVFSLFGGSLAAVLPAESTVPFQIHREAVDQKADAPR